MKMLYSAIASLMFVFLTACSTNQGSLPQFDSMLLEASGQNGRACVRSHDIDGYGTLKHRVISIDGGRKYYLATLMPGCNTVETSMAALFAGGFGEICGGGRDKIVTRDDHCQIKHMFEFESREDAFALYDELSEKRKEMQEALKASE